MILDDKNLKNFVLTFDNKITKHKLRILLQKETKVNKSYNQDKFIMN